MKPDNALQRLPPRLPERRKALLPSIPQPQPIEPPDVDPDLPYLPALERSAEVLRYQTLRVEYALSPEGRLRAWIKLVLIAFIAIGLPILLFTPVAVYLASGFADVATELAFAASGLMKACVSIAVLGGLVLIAYLVFSRR